MSGRVDHAANAVKLIDDVDEMIDGIGRDSINSAEGVVALSLVEATRAVALATLAVAEQQRIANCLQVALVDQLTQIALTLPVPGYPTDPSVRIRDYLSPGDWEGLGL